MQLMKVCRVCQRDLPLSQFTKMPSGRLGVKPFCKVCRRTTDKPEWRRTTWKWHPRDRFRKYGLTADSYAALELRQGSACAICGKVPKELVIDHCHETKRVRGLLCRPCNSAIGVLGDSSESLMRAVDYLRVQ